MHRIWLLAVAMLLGTADSATAGSVVERVQGAKSVRVCIWPDYYGITYRDVRTQQLSGMDIDLSAELGRDLKISVQYIDSSFLTLIDDLTTDRCDVAMFAVGMLSERMKHLSFTRPYMGSGIYGVTTRANKVITRWNDIDRPGVAVAVQAGTFMEPVMTESLKLAKLVRVSAPATRERELTSGRVDVFMTDYPYSRQLLDKTEWARVVAPPTPFHVLPYAYAVKPGDAEWLSVIDRFVERIKRDGRLEAAARRHKLSDHIVRD